MAFEITNVHARPHNHEVCFWSDDVAFVDIVGKFVAAALIAHSPCIVFATKAHRDSLKQALRSRDVDVDAAIMKGTYVSLDAAEVLSTFMTKGWPDRSRFFEGFSELIESTLKTAKDQTSRIAIFGEGVALLCDEGNTEAAIRMEQLGNELVNKYNVDILCAYPLSICSKEHEQDVKRICAQHSAAFSR